MKVAKIVAIAVLTVWPVSVCLAEQIATRATAQPGMVPAPPPLPTTSEGRREFPIIGGPSTTGGEDLPTAQMIEQWVEDPERMDDEDCRSLIDNYFQISSLNSRDVDVVAGIADALLHCLKNHADNE